MMSITHPRHSLLSLLPLLLPLLSACSTQPSQATHFYRLAVPDAHKVEIRQTAPGKAQQPRVGLGPVRLASYLDRPQIVSRITPYRIELNDFHHWAGTLQENIVLALTDALRTELGQAAVIGYPWHRAIQPLYQVALDVTRFDAEAGQVLLQARWTLVKPASDELLAVREARIAEPLQGTGPEALVAAASRAMVQLAQQLAAALQPYL